MQLLICPGYHPPALTHDFLQALFKILRPERLWILPVGSGPRAVSGLFRGKQSPQLDQRLQVIGFSAGVVAAYPLMLAWQGLGGTGRLIAIDGWGMPLPGDLSIYRMSHDAWTHRTTYVPTPAESRGYFYAKPAVDHLALWQSPQITAGTGAIGHDAPRPMTALEFMGAVLLSV